MKYQVRLTALTTIAAIALSASAQTARKPSGAVHPKSAAAVAQRQGIRPPDASERAATASEVRQEEQAAAPPEAPSLAVPDITPPALAIPSTNTLPAAPAAAILPTPASGMETPALATRPATSNVMLPIGTAIRMKLDSAVSTSDSRPGDKLSGKVTQDVVVEGKTVIPAGATLSGRVMRLFEPRRIAGRPAIQLVPDSVTIAKGKSLSIAAVVVDTGNPKRLKV